MALFDGSDSLEARSVFVKRYFAYPNTLDPMTPVYRKGLIPVGIFAMMSLISVFALICFITYRLISWRRHYKQYVGYNQYVILIYNLLLADLQQSIAFTITFHWLKLEKIVAPTVPCFIQGWFLHIGDVASGFFVFVIAVHTWLGVVKGYRMSYKWFVVTIICTWMAALFLTVLGPIMHGDHFFTRAGGWCWVSVDFEPERLWLHYIWIFIVEFGTVGIYAHIFFHLRRSIRSIIHNDTSKLTRATKFMIMYPATYVILTMPLAIGRMVTMAGVQMPDMFFCIAGSFLVSSGWVDALLYTLTRRIFVGSDISSHGQYNRTVTTTTNNAARPGDDYGLQSMHKEMGGRTVTITGGGHRISRLVDSKSRRSQHRRGNPDLLSETSLTGSQDSIVKPGPNAIGIITETNIHVESAESSDGDMSPRSPRPAVTRNNSHSGYSTHSR